MDEEWVHRRKILLSSVRFRERVDGAARVDPTCLLVGAFTTSHTAKKRSHVCEHDHGGYWKQLAPSMIVPIPHTASWDSASMVESLNAASPSAFCPLTQALAFPDRDMHLPRLLPIDHLHPRDQVSNRPSSARVPHDPSPAGPPPRAMPASASPTPLLQFPPPFPPFQSLRYRRFLCTGSQTPDPQNGLSTVLPTQPPGSGFARSSSPPPPRKS